MPVPPIRIFAHVPLSQLIKNDNEDCERQRITPPTKNFFDMDTSRPHNFTIWTLQDKISNNSYWGDKTTYKQQQFPPPNLYSISYCPSLKLYDQWFNKMLLNYTLVENRIDASFTHDQIRPLRNNHADHKGRVTSIFQLFAFGVRPFLPIRIQQVVDALRIPFLAQPWNIL